MSFSELMSIWWPEQSGVSVLIWCLIIILLMWMARTPAHKTIRSFSLVIRNAMRMASHSVTALEKRLMERNREVLLTAGMQETERYIEREFQRVEDVVTRDLSGYPSLQRDLKEQIIRIDEDYRESSEVPPVPKNYIDAIEAVNKINSNGDSMVANVLKAIHATMKRNCEKETAEYRRASKQRHKLLKTMMPYWRNLSKTLESVEKKIVGLEDRSKVIDSQIEKYEQIMAKTNLAERILTSSSITQFFTSALVLIVALLGAYVNFQLIALPMSEMVGGASRLGPMRASDVAALVLVFFEIVLGLFLMEAFQITRLFPIISALNDKLRRNMAIAAFVLLFIFASVESSLAYMRDLLAADREALTQSLAGVAVAAPEFRWITTVGQMVMGFILPFALMLVAIPLESFVHSLRTVIGMVGVFMLQVLAFIIRQIGSLSSNIGYVLLNIYDLIIFIPLKLEEMLSRTKQKPEPEKTDVEMTPVES
ncbi:MAG: hypothetical protein OQK32_04740 [Gammaproteobacteria bacterium]|nr:hypothetical protein [Gammaproteobacteria bacterium]MCW8922454.1 hypothetical protein [Gammaproteobacteria bacterium]